MLSREEEEDEERPETREGSTRGSGRALLPSPKVSTGLRVGDLRRTRKKAQKRPEPVPVFVAQSGGGDRCSKLTMVAMGVIFLLWYIRNQSERAALLELAARSSLANPNSRQGQGEAASLGSIDSLSAFKGGGAGQAQKGGGAKQEKAGASQQERSLKGGFASQQADWDSGWSASSSEGAAGKSASDSSRLIHSNEEMKRYSAGMDKALSLLTDPSSKGAEKKDATTSSSSSRGQQHSGVDASSYMGSNMASQRDAGGGHGRLANKRWAPINGSFVLRWGKPKRKHLGMDINKENLATIMLDANRFATESALSGPLPSSANRGPPCPEFEYAYQGLPGIASCWQKGIEDKTRAPSKYPYNCPTLAESCVQEIDFRPHEAWSAQVLVLHNVYVNLAGQIFNKSHYFDHNECAFEQVFSYRANRTRVTHFKELVHMIDWYAWSARSFLLELLPLWVSLQRVLPAMKGVPVAFGHRLTHKRSQLEQMIAQGGKSVLGLEFDSLNFRILQGNDLFHAERLVVPLHQRCGNPSRSMWTLIRNQHFLPQDGIPIFHNDYKINAAGLGSPPTTTWDRDDWVVLLAFKAETWPFLQKLQLEKKLQEVFPPERVLQYRESSLTIPRRKALLNRARLLISARDNVLADMVFMPRGASVFEIRPVEDPDPTFHLLAEVCGLNYYLLFSEGFKKTLTKAQATSKLKIKDGRSLDRLLNKLGMKLQRKPNATTI